MSETNVLSDISEKIIENKDDKNFTQTLDVVQESFLKIVSDPKILESFIENYGLQDMVDKAIKNQ